VRKAFKHLLSIVGTQNKILQVLMYISKTVTTLEWPVYLNSTANFIYSFSTDDRREIRWKQQNVSHK